MELNIETDFVPSNAVEACLLAYARDLEARNDLLTMALEEADEKCCCGVCGL